MPAPALALRKVRESLHPCLTQKGLYWYLQTWNRKWRNDPEGIRRICTDAAGQYALHPCDKWIDLLSSKGRPHMSDAVFC